MKISRLIGFALPLLATTVLAQDAGETVVRTQRVDLLEVLERGGFMMYPLAFLSVLTVFLILFYFFTIRRGAVVSSRFMNAAEAMLRNCDYLGLIAYCHRRNESVARVAEKSLDFLTKNTGADISEVREVAEAEGARQAGILSQRITYLADIGAIAPMVGLLGTVIGMIKAFLEISQGNQESVQQIQLAGGVSEALITTASGLVIGIIAIIFYSFFRGRVQRYISELETDSTHLMALLSAQQKASPLPATIV